MDNHLLKAGVIQTAFSDNRGTDKAQLESLLDQAAATGAKLIVLPELHAGHYFCQHESTTEFDRAERIPGPTTEWLSVWARRTACVIVGSVFEQRAAGLYHNTAVVMDSDGSLAGTYRKMHIPDDPGFYEKFYFTPGDGGFIPVDTSIGRIGVLVCWDQWFPEAARLMSLAGAELLVYPTAIGWSPEDNEDERRRQLDSWITIQRSHAISNGVPLLSANRIGHEADPTACGDGIEFWGHSFICGPQGEILAQGNSRRSTVVSSDIDLGKSDKTRRIWPFFRDRRIDAYAGLLQRYIDTPDSEGETT